LLVIMTKYCYSETFNPTKYAPLCNKAHTHI